MILLISDIDLSSGNRSLWGPREPNSTIQKSCQFGAKESLSINSKIRYCHFPSNFSNLDTLFLDFQRWESKGTENFSAVSLKTECSRGIFAQGGRTCITPAGLSLASLLCSCHSRAWGSNIRNTLCLKKEFQCRD